MDLFQFGRIDESPLAKDPDPDIAPVHSRHVHLSKHTGIGQVLQRGGIPKGSRVSKRKAKLVTTMKKHHRNTTISPWHDSCWIVKRKGTRRTVILSSYPRPVANSVVTEAETLAIVSFSQP